MDTLAILGIIISIIPILIGIAKFIKKYKKRKILITYLLEPIRFNQIFEKELNKDIKYIVDERERYKAKLKLVKKFIDLRNGEVFDGKSFG